MRMRAGVQHHTATRACKPAARKLAGNSCESGRMWHQPDECCRVANAWWNYIVSIAKVSPDF